MKKISLFLFILVYLFNYIIFAQSFVLESSAFKQNSIIPDQFTCKGRDLSPPLTWRNAPEKTQSFALVVQDPDAPNAAWTHWFLYNIPANITQLDAGSPLPEGAQYGKNSWGGPGYRGPCPSIGAHRYVFKIYALDNHLPTDPEASPDSLLNSMTGHVLATAELVGLYQTFN